MPQWDPARAVSMHRARFAAWATTGLSYNGDARTMDVAFLEALFAPDTARVGEAVLAAHRAFAEAGRPRRTAAMYSWLGDPALLVIAGD